MRFSTLETTTVVYCPECKYIHDEIIDAHKCTKCRKKFNEGDRVLCSGQGHYCDICKDEVKQYLYPSKDEQG